MKHFTALLDQSLMMGRSIDGLIDSLDETTGMHAVEAIETDASIAFAEARVETLLPETAEAEMVVDLLGSIATCFPSLEAFDACATGLHTWLLNLGSLSDVRAKISHAEETYSAWDEASGAFMAGETDEAAFLETEALNEAAAAQIEYPIEAFPGVYCDVGFHFGYLVLDVKRESDVDRITVSEIEIIGLDTLA